MTTHAIVELEEGALNVVVGVRTGQTTKITRSLRLPVADLGRETLTSVLRSIGSDALQGAAGVHVVLGERRMQHFASTVPRLAPNEVVQFVVREALRLTGAQTAAEVLVAPRLLHRRSDGKLALGTAAIARSVWEPLRAAFAANNLNVLGLYSMETCLALAAERADGAASAETTAVLECNSGRARFVLCSSGSPVQVRRFLIGGGEGNAAALASQLTMELPRTFDWLRETGQTLPKTLVLGTRVTIDDEMLPMLQGDDLQVLRRARPPVETAADMAQPSLGVAMLLARLGAGQALPSLLAPPSVALPVRARHFVGIAALLAAGFAASWSAVVDGTAMLGDRDERLEVQQETRQLEIEIAARAGTDPSALARLPDDARLQTALALRRPISRLLADVSNAATPQLALEELKFGSAERVIVIGVVAGNSRQEALKALAAFGQRLRQLPFLRTDGQDEIVEVAGQPNRFRFRLGMAWRSS
jgi:hypothetical protein